MTFSTSDLADAHPGVGSCSTQFRQFGRRRRFFGEIHTVRCCTDNTDVKRALATRSPGKVLVVDADGSLVRALIGDRLAVLGMENEWAGIVLNGVVRDRAALEALDFGIKALGSNPMRSFADGDTEAGVTVSFGEVEFVPGQWVYSDEDGILVSNVPLPV